MTLVPPSLDDRLDEAARAKDPRAAVSVVLREAYAVDPAKADFEQALGRSVLDEMVLYQAEQEASIAAALKALGLAEAAA